MSDVAQDWFIEVWLDGGSSWVRSVAGLRAVTRHSCNVTLTPARTAQLSPASSYPVELTTNLHEDFIGIYLGLLLVESAY